MTTKAKVVPIIRTAPLLSAAIAARQYELAVYVLINAAINTAEERTPAKGKAEARRPTR